MTIDFWGVRGSISVANKEFMKYGGNTSCVSVTGNDGTIIILDAGTGIVNLSKKLMGENFSEGKGEANLLISHTHWDHIQGFPFFVPIFFKGNTINIYGPLTHDKNIEEIIEGEMNPHYSPVYSLSNLSAKLNFITLKEEEEFSIGSINVKYKMVNHSNVFSLAYTLEEDGKKMIFLTDIEYTGGIIKRDIIDYVRDSDLVIHDSHFLPNLLNQYRGYGHSSIYEAINISLMADVKKLLLFHYSPDLTDKQIDNLIERYKIIAGNLLDFEPAYEGLSVKL